MYDINNIIYSMISQHSLSGAGTESRDSTLDAKHPGNPCWSDSGNPNVSGTAKAVPSPSWRRTGFGAEPQP